MAAQIDPSKLPALKPQHIVVVDPENEYWEGALVDDARAHQLRQRGVVMLPCVAELFRFSGVAGFAKRAWGAGWPLDTLHPTIVAPLTLYCPRAVRKVHWCARLVVDPDVAERLRQGEKLAGMIRFASDRGQQTPFYTGISSDQKPILAEELPPPDEGNGWILSGTGTVNVPQEGHYGFGLYGTAPGARVVWVAASMTVS